MLTPWYVTGFCESAATFTYSKADRTFSLYFAIKQRADSLYILENIREYFNHIGAIYGVSASSAYYRVTKIDELQRIIEHFDKYGLQNPKKQAIYKIWREMVQYKLHNYRSIDYVKLTGLAGQLSQITKI